VSPAGVTTERGTAEGVVGQPSPGGAGRFGRIRRLASGPGLGAEPAAAPGVGRWGSWASHLLLAVVAYVPQLMAQPGVVSSDTKTYLYLDINRFIPASASMWDPTVGLGTVTHQQIGYLFPMGPFFWFFHAIGVPVWVAQRLWVGSILFAAGAGVLFLCRTLALRGLGPLVAGFAYMFSPYFLQYVGRISVLLLPWAGLPWLVALAALAVRRGGWRDSARFAVVVALVSSINATSLLYVGLGPALWLVYSVVGLREATWRQAGSAALKLAGMSLVVSFWWIAGLAVEGGFGVAILQTTETVQTVSQTSTPIEVLRGLGYWYFYGTDRLGPWVSSSVQLTQEIAALGFGFAVPALSFVAAVFTRWRYRAFFVLLVLMGLVLAVGTYPFADPTWLGHALKAFMTETSAGLALRSTDRATPLLALGIAMLLGAGVAALGRRSRPFALGVAALSVAVVAAANPAAFNGSTVADKYTQPARLPGYTLAAAKALNHEGAGSRVLGIPGSDFADYDYGDTTDPVYPAILNRGYVSREQVPQGSTATEDLLYALDDPMQVGASNPNALPPIARLMSVGDVLVQSDLNYERYDQPPPAQLWAQLQPTPSGLGPPTCYGTPRPDHGPLPQVDEAALAHPNPVEPCPLEVMAVANPRPIVRAEPTASPVVLDGDGEGLVAAAGVGLLAHDPTVLYAGTLDQHPGQLTAALRRGATVVVTDTNRHRAFRWDTIVDEAGQTLTATQPQQTDPFNSPVVLFPGAPITSYTVASYLGVRSVTASAYGDAVTYLPEDRPSQAIDGSLDTAWETGAFGQPIGQWWQVQFVRPTTTGAVNLVQPLAGANNRWITRATLTFDGGHPLTVRLGAASRTAQGQTITFPSRTFGTLRIRIDATNMKGTDLNAGPSSVGFAEVRVAGTTATELIDLPSDVLGGTATSTAADRLVLLLTRQRVSPYPPRQDPEVSIDRSFVLPNARTFALTGTARINALIPDDQIDRLVGRQQASGIVAYSKGRLPGNLSAGASAALDGNAATVWSPGFGAASQLGSWIHVDLPKPITFDHLDLQIVDDGRHSVPTELTVATENGSTKVRIPPLRAGTRPGSTVSVPVSFPALHGRHLQFTVSGVHLRSTRSYTSRQLTALPVGIAELGIPGVVDPPPPAAIPSTCRSDLLSIDGQPVWLSVGGSSSAALAGDGLNVSLCGPDAAGLHLGAGSHLVEAANGHTTGWNLDELALDSAGGGTAMADVSPSALVAPPPSSAGPTARATSQSATTIHVRVRGVTASTGPFYVVLGESINRGWTATVDGGPSLGAPELMDGFANGWIVNPRLVAGEIRHGTLTLTLRWTPQRLIWAALVVSGAGLAAALLLSVLPDRTRWRRRGRHRRAAAAAGTGPGGGEVLDAEPAAAVATLASPLAYPPARPRLLVGAVTALLLGAGLAAVTRPWIGLAVGAAAAVALLVPRTRGLLTAGAVGLMVAAGAVVVVDQATHPAQAGGTWPPTFSTAAVLAWTAVACLVADAIVELVRRAAARSANGPEVADDPIRATPGSDPLTGPAVPPGPDGSATSTSQSGPSA
jgi:arabinofuranan 3-O-arabinosyltransferase